MVELREYHRTDGSNPYAEWFAGLDVHAATRIAIAVTRMAQGNFSNVKGVGGGVYERRIDFGPGYRVYFGRDGDRIVILFGGGTKKRQGHDIAAAHAAWQDYRRRKPQEE